MAVTIPGVRVTVLVPGRVKVLRGVGVERLGFSIEIDFRMLVVGLAVIFGGAVGVKVGVLLFCEMVPSDSDCTWATGSTQLPAGL